MNDNVRQMFKPNRWPERHCRIIGVRSEKVGAWNRNHGTHVAEHGWNIKNARSLASVPTNVKLLRISANVVIQRVYALWPSDGASEEVRLIIEGRGQPDSEHIYAVLRREIVSGVVVADQVVTSAEVSERFECGKKTAQEVLTALAADGYLKLKRKMSGYLPEHWSDDEILERLDNLMLLHEICALRLPGSAPEKIEDLRRHRLEFERGRSSETRFLALLNWVSVPISLQSLKPVAEFGANLIPSAILRIAWRSIEISSSVAAVMAELERHLADGDRRATRACITEFWTIVQPHSGEFSTGRISGATGVSDLNVREPDLAGKRPSFGRSDGFGTELLPRLENNPRMSQKLPLDHCAM